MMHNPAHSGEVLKEFYLEPLGHTVTEAARKLGVSRKTLSQLVNTRAGVSPEMALLLAKAFNTTPGGWLNMQKSYDLWHVQKSVNLSEVQLLKTASA